MLVVVVVVVLAARLLSACTSEFREFRLSPFRFPRTHRQLKSSSWSSLLRRRRRRSSISISFARSLSVGLSLSLSLSLSLTLTRCGTTTPSSAASAAPGSITRPTYLCSCPPARSSVCALLDDDRACFAHLSGRSLLSFSQSVNRHGGGLLSLLSQCSRDSADPDSVIDACMHWLQFSILKWRSRSAIFRPT